jgi:hypothetical protein
MMETRDSGDVTSMETARLDFFDRMMERSCFVKGFVVLEAKVS